MTTITEPSPVQISVVLTVRNAEARIAGAMESIAARLEASGDPHELVVVDDGSDDATAQVAARVGLRHPGVSVIPLHRRAGEGYAGRVGLLAANGIYRVLLPVLEGSAFPPIGSWEDVLNRLATGAGIVVGRPARLLGLDARVAQAVGAVESAYRYGAEFSKEVARLARRAGVKVAEARTDVARDDAPGPPASRAITDSVKLLIKNRWPRGDGIS